MVVILAITMPLGPLCLRFLPPQLIIAATTCLALFGTFLSSFTTSLNMFILLYGVLYSSGLGMAYLVPLICGWEYYKNNKGIVSGIIIGGFGFGSFIFSYVCLAIANPNNSLPLLPVDGGSIFSEEQPESDNAPRMLRVCTLFWMILSFIGLACIQRKSKKITEIAANQHLLAGDENNQTKSGEITSIDLKNMTTIDYPTFKDALCKTTTLQIWIMLFCSSCYPMFMANVFKSYGEKNILKMMHL
jgi:OFA family oxalate/formate antiporter-like MFS transporter